ncbi:MAG: FAD-dependent oxidoreductase [Microcella pacifica]|uniref:FAD-dependent oxidoreductase n=1 Tax=Microcella pacifica TaxID=2591847 RepID=UPI003315EE9A
MDRESAPEGIDPSTVIVAGGGILGCLSSLLLVEAGHSVTLIDAAPELWRGASAAGEGKIHLGLVYARASASTRSQMLQAALDFAPIVERAVGERVDWASLTSDPFDYLVMPDSLASTDELSAVYRSLDEEHARRGRPPYLGLGVDRLAALNPGVDQTGLPVFATAERAIDPNLLREVVLDAVARRAPALRVLTGTRVTAVEHLEGGVRAHLAAGAESTMTAAALVDARWEWQGFGVSGVSTPPRNLRVKSSVTLPAGASSRTVTLVVGPYGDVVRRSGSVYASWYPAARRAHEHRPFPSPDAVAALEEATLAGSAHDSAHEQLAALVELGLLEPGAEPVSRHAGFILGEGTLDIDSPRSELHDRRGSGVAIAGKVVLPRTLKFSTAPRAAQEAAAAVTDLLGGRSARD